MLIRKLYKFENAHVVRNCSSERCKFSIHGHSYKVEVLLKSDVLDNGQMVYDFGLMKGTIKDIIDSFDHATAFWDKDNEEYIEMVKKHSMRWVSLPVSPSAEQFSRVIFMLVYQILDQTIKNNGEGEVEVDSVIVHETDTGYAQCFFDDVINPRMGKIDLNNIVFSPAVKAEWKDPMMFEKMKGSVCFHNPAVELQVKA